MACCDEIEVVSTDLVSIVLPVFNTADYLSTCIESLLCQTYPNIEIVIVDDGSSDGSSDICDHYSISNENISVYHIENHGLSYARNLGISASKGSYITFIDSDDVVPAYYIDYLMKGLANGSADLSCVQLQEIENQSAISSLPCELDLPAFEIVNTKTALSKLLRNVDICESACGKVAKASFWKQHKFPVGRVYEDLATCAGIINDADSIAFSPVKIYGQVYRVGSLSRKGKISNKQYSDWSYALNRSMNTIKNSKHYDELEDEIECFMMLNSVRLIRLFNDRETFEKAQALHKRDTRTAPGKQEVYLMSGFVRCADCKKAMRRKTARDIAYYSCRSYTDKKICSKHSIRQDKLENAVLAALQMQIALVDRLAEEIERINNAPVINRESKRLSHSLKQAEKQLKQYNDASDSLYLDWKSGEITKEEYRRLKGKIAEQIQQLEANISYLKEEMQVMADGIGTDDPYLTAFLKYKNIQSLNRGIMVELVKAVWVHENGEITVDFNFADEYQRIIDYIENNHNVIRVIENKAI